MTTTPRDAATVIILREHSHTYEVLLLRRHGASRFMPGAYVFPGGTVDPADADMGVLPRLSGSTDLAAALGEPSLAEGDARAVFVAAARETLEEAGLLFAYGIEKNWRPSRAGRSFTVALAESGGTVDLSLLKPWYRWITPPTSSLRFDTRFFVALAPREQEAENDGRETTAGLWLSPSTALDRAHAGTLELAPPTLRSLELLEDLGSVSAVMGEANSRRPPIVAPLRISEGGTPVVVLPGDESHAEREPVAGRPTRMHWSTRGWRSRPRSA